MPAVRILLIWTEAHHADDVAVGARNEDAMRRDELLPAPPLIAWIQPFENPVGDDAGVRIAPAAHEHARERGRICGGRRLDRRPLSRWRAGRRRDSGRRGRATPTIRSVARRAATTVGGARA